MKKIIIVLVIIISIFFLLPLIKIDKNNKLMFISYCDDIGRYEDYTCYHESISYFKKKDISIKKFNIKKFFIFYLFKIEYENGNLCDTEYLIEESYIENFVENAEIIDNINNINIEKLIEGKTAIVSNTRYSGNDYENYINYKLDDKEEIMYIFYHDDLLVIQIGDPDETTKYIAYK